MLRADLPCADRFR